MLFINTKSRQGHVLPHQNSSVDLAPCKLCAIVAVGRLRSEQVRLTPQISRILGWELFSLKKQCQFYGIAEIRLSPRHFEEARVTRKRTNPPQQSSLT
jgi:hypothetical protein